MHLRTDTVADEFAYHCESFLFHPLLHRGRNISQTVAGTNLFNSLLERFARHSQQLLALRSNFSHRNRQRRVREVTIQLDAEIHGQNVALANLPLWRRNAVHNFLIDRSAHRPRISAVPLKSRPRVVLHGERLGKVIELFGGYARADDGAHLFERTPDDLPGLVHLFEFFRRFTDDHLAPPRARKFHSVHDSLLPHSSNRLQFPEHRVCGNSPPAVSSYARKPPSALLRSPDCHPTAESASRHPRRKSPVLSARVRKCCRSRRQYCTSNVPKRASQACRNSRKTQSQAVYRNRAAQESCQAAPPAARCGENRRR